MTWPSLKLWCVSISSAALFLLFSPPARSQNIINVPADYPAIQSAINAANSGDTVLVAPGTYVENINFNGKAIIVTSSNGPAATIVDGNHNGTVVTFNHSETLSSVLNGFTIRNGFLDGGAGAGIAITFASPTITSNVITGNHSAVAIGIYVYLGSPLISNNTITSNDPTGAGGGGLGGGGIAIFGTTDTQIINNTITNNTGGGEGGGISVLGSALIRDNLITGNSTYNDGGGISVDSEGLTVVSDNIVANNHVGGGGSGGGLYIYARSDGPVTVTNNTFVANAAFDGSSGIFTSGSAQYANLTNNIVVAATNQTAVSCDTIRSSVSAVFAYNDVYSATGIPWTASCDFTSNPGNISTDPLFVDPNGNFHLQSGSPVLDAGSNSASGLPSTDFDGSPRIVDGNRDGNAVVDLGAYELQPTTITWTPDALAFDPQPVGTTSPSQTLTLSNTGGQKLYFSLSITPPFAETDNCGGVILAGSSCSISVTFRPPSIGIVTGSITLRDNAPQSPQTISLSETGGVPSVTLTPSSLSFDGQLLGSSSPAQALTLSNAGDGPLTIASIGTTGDFSQTSNCSGSLAGGASCSINVTFLPTVLGARQSTLIVTDNAAGGPQTVSLTGTGLGAVASLSPSSLSFAVQARNTTSAAQTVTLSNTGNVPLGISGIATTGDFAQSNSCGAALAAGTSCSIAVTFTPSIPGIRQGVLTITDNTSSSPQTVSLTGTGTLPQLALNPDILSFANQAVGTTSAPKTMTLSNTGSVPATISGIAISGDFSQTNTCGTSLAVGTNCSFTVTFSPTATGPRIGYVTISGNASGSPAIGGLQGSGIAPQVSFSPANLSLAVRLSAQPAPPKL